MTKKPLVIKQQNKTQKNMYILTINPDEFHQSKIKMSHVLGDSIGGSFLFLGYNRC